MTAGVMSKADKAALAAERKKSQILERGLRRKDKSLAETNSHRTDQRSGERRGEVT